MDESEQSRVTGMPDRRTVILQAAGGVLLRYGYRKASVDEVARVAGVSRQGIYLYFPSKDVLFAATVGFLLDQSIEASRAALSAPGVSLEQRLLNAFEAMAPDAVSVNLDEVIEAAERLTGRSGAELEGAIVAEFTTALERSPASSSWRRHGDDAEMVATLLYATSAGCKRLASSTPDYVEKMRHAIRFICNP